VGTVRKILDEVIIVVIHKRKFTMVIVAMFVTFLLCKKHKRLGLLTNNFCPANFEKILLQRAFIFYSGYKI